MNHNMDFAPFGHGPGPEVVNNEKKTLLEALIKVFMSNKISSKLRFSHVYFKLKYCYFTKK